MPLIAYTRAVSPRLADCELTHLDREPLDVAGAEAEHARYEAVLAALGAEVRRLPSTPHLPDGVFVEDAAVVLDEVALITRPGAASRRPETESVAAALMRHRTLVHITAPGTLDGGDVLVCGRTLYIGLSTRTSRDAITQAATLLKPFGYGVVPVEFAGCLHLKSAVTRVADDLLLLNPHWVRADAFAGLASLPVDPAEPHAANALALGGAIVHPLQHARTRARLEAAGFAVRTVPQIELAKAEAGVTCCSLLVNDAAG
jgi:dimethylargininase